ncbi:uncharacterized protein ISCGN_004770 [Ixodes scapularis]
MRSTTPTCGSFDCRKHIRITYLRLPIQLCYTLDSTRYGAPETELGKCDTPWLYELEAKMIVDPAQTLRLMHTVPFPVFVQPPGHCVPERVAPVALEPNQIYHIAVKQQVKYRLPAPYPSDCKDYLYEGPRDEFYGFPSKEAIEIFGYIGGYLGMWLGFSLLELLVHYGNRPRKLRCLTVNATEEKATSFEHTQRVPHVRARRRVAVSGKSRSSLLTSAGIPDNRLKRMDLWAKSVIADEPLATD